LDPVPGDTLQLDFQAVRPWFSGPQAVSKLFSFQSVTCRVYRLDKVIHPFLLGLILRFLSRGKCLLEDETGQQKEVTLGFLAAGFAAFLRDWLDQFDVIGQVWRALSPLQVSPARPAPKLDLSKTPFYLRMDLLFGLKSGGSVGHIAGVLNNLDSFTGKPIFLTSDPMPTVRKDLETWVVEAGKRFWDFREIQAFAYNETFLKEVLETAKKEPVAFLYQRYSLHHYAGLQAARTLGVPLVLEYNGSEIWASRNWGKPVGHEKLSLEVEDLNLRAADLVAVVSEPLKEELLSRGVKENRILVNPNGVEPEKYSPQIPGEPVRKKYGLEGKTVVGFIGTFGRWHGAEALVEAFGRLLQKAPQLRQTARLLMVGDGNTMPQVKEAIAKHGLSDLCVLTGLVPQVEGPAHLAACDILASPTVPNRDGSKFFGSPTKLFEYMAMGKGIVASDLDQIGQILKHDETAWLVKPGEVESLAEGLRVLLEDPARRLRLGEAARKEVTEKYTWKEHTRRIIEKLKEVCA